MDNKKFRALVVRKSSDKRFSMDIEKKQTDSLPEGDVLIRVDYSSLNYKDALSATGNPGVTRSFPHTPGIDAAGTIEESRSSAFQKGQQVIVTSYDLGMNTDGGFGRYIRVPAEWIVQMPHGLSLKESMIFGTAGFTAAMSVDQLAQTIGPEKGPVLVTGATGGVGSMACGILSHIGYKVAAVSGKTQTRLLDQLGVDTVITREKILEKADRPMLSEKWAGVIDTVGGPILAAAIKSTCQDGVVTCCGNVASFDLPINVFPFILRGVRLIGIDSQHCPMEKRTQLWNCLASEWKFNALEQMHEQIGLEQLPAKISDILKGNLQGRTLVSLD